MAETKKKEKDGVAVPSLEESIARLEAIVERLESGEADLEASIGLFAEGRKLGTDALKRLEGLERKVELVLRKDQDGLVVEDFEEERDA